MNLRDYHIFWYDSYSGGYIRGVTHAVNSNGYSVCGRNLTGDIGEKPVDGGYLDCNQQSPSCKNCQKKMGITDETFLKDGIPLIKFNNATEEVAQ